MEAELIFLMGKTEIRFPRDRFYARQHLWLQADPDDPGGRIVRVGFTAYSVRLLKDVYFLEWTVGSGPVRQKQEIGQIESAKAVSSLYPPGAGAIANFNDALLDDPTPINTDPYGSGWLYRFIPEEPPLTPEQYLARVQEGWDADQRSIKKQVEQGL
jgi:glycine cleavage system H protein